jgi:hypothetical protein
VGIIFGDVFVSAVTMSFIPVFEARAIPMLVIMLWYAAVMVIPSVIMIPIPRVSIDPFMIPA